MDTETSALTLNEGGTSVQETMKTSSVLEQTPFKDVWTTVIVESFLGSIFFWGITEILISIANMMSTPFVAFPLIVVLYLAYSFILPQFSTCFTSTTLIYHILTTAFCYIGDKCNINDIKYKKQDVYGKKDKNGTVWKNEYSPGTTFGLYWFALLGMVAGMFCIVAACYAMFGSTRLKEFASVLQIEEVSTYMLLLSVNMLSDGAIFLINRKSVNYETSQRVNEPINVYLLQFLYESKPPYLNKHVTDAIDGNKHRRNQELAAVFAFTTGVYYYIAGVPSEMIIIFSQQASSNSSGRYLSLFYIPLLMIGSKLVTGLIFHIVNGYAYDKEKRTLYDPRKKGK